MAGKTKSTYAHLRFRTKTSLFFAALLLFLSYPAVFAQAPKCASLFATTVNQDQLIYPVEYALVMKRVEAGHSKVILMPSWRLLLPAIRTKLQKLGIESDAVFIRLFSAKRIEIALETGSDRNDQSHVFDVPGYDSSREERASLGITDDKVTYGVTLDLSAAEVSTIPFSENDNVISHMLAPFQDPPAFSFQAIAVYIPSSLQRLSSVEYAFKEKPKDALLFVLVNEETVDWKWKKKYSDTLPPHFLLN